MKYSIKTKVSIAILAFVGLLLSGQSMAQLDEFPRTPDGKPDFSGI